jgi:hypothetical protein
MTGFVAAGTGMRSGAVVPLLPLEHIAPFIAALLGLEMPEADGVLLPGLLAVTEEKAPSRRPRSDARMPGSTGLPCRLGQVSRCWLAMSHIEPLSRLTVEDR